MGARNMVAAVDAAKEYTEHLAQAEEVHMAQGGTSSVHMAPPVVEIDNATHSLAKLSMPRPVPGATPFPPHDWTPLGRRSVAHHTNE